MERKMKSITVKDARSSIGNFTGKQSIPESKLITIPFSCKVKTGAVLPLYMGLQLLLPVSVLFCKYFRDLPAAACKAAGVHIYFRNCQQLI